MAAFSCLPPEQVAVRWPHVQWFLERLHRRGSDCEPHAVYSALTEELTATLHFVFHGNTKPVGFFILTTDPENFEALYVWVAVAYEGVDPFRNETMEALTRLAQISGFKQIRFQTHRRGWEKKAQLLGFKRDNDYYFMEV